MTGRLGGPTDGHDLKCRLEGDALRGRVGGALMGKDLDLEISETGVSGRVGGERGFEVSLELQAGELVGSLGPEPLKMRGVDRVTGRLGDSLSGVDIAAQQRGARLGGRIGGLSSKAFEIELGDAPGWIGALVAVVAFYALERHRPVAR